MGERVATTEFSVVYHCEFIFYRKNPSNIKIKVLDTEWKATRWNIRPPSSNKNPVTDPSFNACLRSKYNICNRARNGSVSWNICYTAEFLLAGKPMSSVLDLTLTRNLAIPLACIYMVAVSTDFFFQIHIRESTLAVFCVSQNTAAV